MISAEEFLDKHVGLLDDLISQADKLTSLRKASDVGDSYRTFKQQLKDAVKNILKEERSIKRQVKSGSTVDSRMRNYVDTIKMSLQEASSCGMPNISSHNAEDISVAAYSTRSKLDKYINWFHEELEGFKKKKE